MKQQALLSLCIGGDCIGVIRTDKWLDADFHDPVKISRKFMKLFGEDDPQKVYEYLMKFGMYKPNRRTLACFEELKRRNTWEKTEKIFKKYQRKWDGKDIPIYIFPMNGTNSFFGRTENLKSGVAFKDKLFLFLTPLADEMELEALFVHEYHHTCRINKQNKSWKKFTLQDSLIMEGLAEYAVETCCGPKYRARWCNYYSRKEIHYFWERFLQKNLQIEKRSEQHDEIFYGYKKYPKMIGYAAGYEIVSIFKEKQNLTLKDSLLLPSERFFSELEVNE